MKRRATSTTAEGPPRPVRRANAAVPAVFLLLCAWTFLAWPPSLDPFPYFLFLPVLAVSGFYFVRALNASLGAVAKRRLAGILLGFVLLIAAALAVLQIWACSLVSSQMPLLQQRLSAQGGPVPSQVMRDATVAMEDGHFYEHHGLDWEALHRALRVNLRAGKVKQGGSTITQQLAKNLFLTKDRTLRRKILEIPLTWELERRFSKPEILTLYTRSIDYGMGQVGIDAAAHYYFGTTPDRLTMAESALLVGIVPHNPQVLPDAGHLTGWQNIGLLRLGGWFSDRYSENEIDSARNIPLRKILIVQPPKVANPQADGGGTGKGKSPWQRKE